MYGSSSTRRGLAMVEVAEVPYVRHENAGGHLPCFANAFTLCFNLSPHAHLKRYKGDLQILSDISAHPVIPSQLPTLLDACRSAQARRIKGEPYTVGRRPGAGNPQHSLSAEAAKRNTLQGLL